MIDGASSAIAVIADTAQNLPGPVRAGLVKALNDLLGGLTAIPAGWVRRPAQAFEDTTAARTAVAAMLAKGVGEEALKDPLVMQAATEIYLPTAIRKARNRVQVAEKAAEHASSKASEGAQAAAPSDDWMNTFMRFAEDASSEQLQDLFGRILAGQVVRPGSFALSTLRTVAELDQSIAEDFSLAWARSVGEAVDDTPEFHLGDWYVRWRRLAEAGLLAYDASAQFLPTFHPGVGGNALWSPIRNKDCWLNVHFGPQCGARWTHIDFTRTGREIGSILAPPDYVSNTRQAGLRLAQQGVARVELYVTGKPMEVVYAGPA